MTLDTFLGYMRKRTYALLFLWLILFMLSVPFLIQNQRERFKTYIFFTVAPKEYSFKEDPAPSINSFYLISASDLFAETIIGWFKNPSFLQDIEKNAYAPLPTLNTRKETKQNVMIFYTTQQQQQGEQLSNAILQRMQESIDEYNRATNTRYSVTNLSNTTIPLSPNIIVDGGISLIASGCISLFLLLLFVPPAKEKTIRR